MSEIASNAKATYDYQILDDYEAGLVLTGQEVKSAKTGHMKLKGAHVVFRGDEAWLIGSHIAKYGKAGPLPDYDHERSRKLLLHKKELRHLRGKSEEKGLTIVPLRAYIKDGRIKVALGVGRGKRQYEKKETIKKRDLDREMRGRMKLSR